MIENTAYNKRIFSLKVGAGVILYHTNDQSCLCLERSRLTHNCFACSRRAMKHYITTTCTNTCKEIFDKSYVDVVDYDQIKLALFTRENVHFCSVAYCQREYHIFIKCLLCIIVSHDVLEGNR